MTRRDSYQKPHAHPKYAHRFANFLPFQRCKFGVCHLDHTYSNDVHFCITSKTLTDLLVKFASNHNKRYGTFFFVHLLPHFMSVFAKWEIKLKFSIVGVMRQFFFFRVVGAIVAQQRIWS